MRKAIALLVALVVSFAVGSLVAEDQKPPPQTLKFAAKPGEVAFDHAKHVEKAKGDCKGCHPGLFPQDRSPLKYKDGMHKTAEGEKKSCGACHVAGGTAFESKANCGKCHVKEAAK